MGTRAGDRLHRCGTHGPRHRPQRRLCWASRRVGGTPRAEARNEFARLSQEGAGRNPRRPRLCGGAGGLRRFTHCRDHGAHQRLQPGRCGAGLAGLRDRCSRRVPEVLRRQEATPSPCLTHMPMTARSWRRPPRPFCRRISRGFHQAAARNFSQCPLLKKKIFFFLFKKKIPAFLMPLVELQPDRCDRPADAPAPAARPS